ncbi:MAG: hypothetical protein A2233_04545 [Candidatus Kerfeldbacteria bacterium RIFOXYA2_FULL_38_24]|uniref:Methionyl-tRNA formyltransferase n=1 Tax=Candidatus Kerfeldbacteria bacterium RIFOXYB2_FULL_38_14 TaxID=1798547 RepID=A0A1G2BAX5_9BACT|nr:MAG: hypothetical protein A2319_05690 [Candidatus Kerfeldbacteria bacterium RIFOXYB2_FULL_38_14]OGY87533.1 MAG: hypothetical protein A2233_04545 [Candidatus Kerfeldbacteria bacterium RIFOXYA2_FULL_38_24]OGY89236.1 MAG: hypothetical protein A2458_04055 [Candidatus Kerfeldbacteria bacterium RIFOXYC2_FULL_38_9]
MINPPIFKIIFFGTPKYAQPTLEFLLQEKNYQIIGCVTQPDKPVGRKQIISPSPIKKFALEKKLPIYQPTTLKIQKENGKKIYQTLLNLKPDLAIVVAYGKIIPKEILAIPKYGCLNLHGSLLPQLRGASPMQQAILAGLPKSGVTLMLMDEGLDTGDIIAQEFLTLSNTETLTSLHDKLSRLNVKILKDKLPQFIQGKLKPQKQNTAQASYTKIIKKTDGEINWQQKPIMIDRQIRALNPWPGTYTFCHRQRLKILKAHLENNKLLIEQVQPEGKKIMSYQDFLQGHPQCQLPPASS